MKLEDFIRSCLKDSEFRKYWEEDNLPIIESTETFIDTYDKLSELFESAEEYENSLADLIKNKGIKSNANSTAMSIEFYEVDNTCPVADFINSIQDAKLKEKTVKNIYNLSELGLALNKTKLSKYVDDGIYELRTQQGNNIDRIFYFFIAGNKIILTNGYIKKTQKLDKSEFKKAKQFMNEYLRRG